ncbi:MAG: DUF4198 domain-containing protein [Gemmatimonadaceae bacterium]
MFISALRKLPAARFGLSLAALLLAGSVASAHDFWIIPDLFDFAADATLHVNGRQGGTKFPDGSAVPAERVVDARVIGATTSTKITEMAVDGASLRLHQKPAAAGQYLIVVGLASRDIRETPAGVVRFLKAEGGAAEAERLERENTLAGLDSVIFTPASYAATIAQVGKGGPRAFGRTSGIRLEFVPQNDPGHVRVGDTLHVKMMGNGKPVPNIGIELATGLDNAAAATASVTRTAFTADANGVVHLPLSKAGPVMLRSAYASRKIGGAANAWDVSRTTYVFNVQVRH